MSTKMAKVFVEQDDEFIYVTMPYDEDAKQALKEDFGARWDPEEKHWKIPRDTWDIRDVEGELRLHFPKDL